MKYFLLILILLSNCGYQYYHKSYGARCEILESDNETYAIVSMSRYGHIHLINYKSEDIIPNKEIVMIHKKCRSKAFEDSLKSEGIKIRKVINGCGSQTFDKNKILIEDTNVIEIDSIWKFSEKSDYGYEVILKLKLKGYGKTKIIPTEVKKYAIDFRYNEKKITINEFRFKKEYNEKSFFRYLFKNF